MSTLGKLANRSALNPVPIVAFQRRGVAHFHEAIGVAVPTLSKLLGHANPEIRSTVASLLENLAYYGERYPSPVTM
jgi:hypothetical protein